MRLEREGFSRAIAVVCLIASVAAQTARSSPSLLIRNVSLIDGNGGPVRTAVSVVARDGPIVFAQPGRDK
jgi:hypothetical protein